MNLTLFISTYLLQPWRFNDKGSGEIDGRQFERRSDTIRVFKPSTTLKYLSKSIKERKEVLLNQNLDNRSLLEVPTLVHCIVNSTRI